METKTRTPYGVFILILAALILPLLLIKPGYYLYRELEYKYGNPTEEEQLVHAYADHAGIAYGKYPKDLIALLETAPEARSMYTAVRRKTRLGRMVTVSFNPSEAPARRMS